MCQVTDELLEKTIGEMSGIEFIQLIKAANEDIIDDKQEDEEDKYVYGIAGIAELFHCSLPTANRIKKSGRIKKAISQLNASGCTAGGEALKMAYDMMGRDAEVVVIPDGVSVLAVKEE